MTFEALVDAAKKLDTSDRLRLVGAVWDSVASEDADVTLSPEQMAELDRRLDRLDREGSKGRPWVEVRRELFGEAGR